jgi:hypothetical protein
MSLLRRTRLDEAGLLAEARRRQEAFLAAQQAERTETAALLAPLYFELEELLAPLRVAAFAGRALPILGWLVETKYLAGPHDDASRKERARLIAARSSRRPQLAFDAGNSIVLAPSWDSGRIARLRRAAHGMLNPYGEMTRLEELASLPPFAGPGPARALVPRAEAYTLFCHSLIVPRDQRDALARTLRDAVSAARHPDQQREDPAPATVFATRSQTHAARRADPRVITPLVLQPELREPTKRATEIREPTVVPSIAAEPSVFQPHVVGRISAEPAVVRPQPRFQSLDAPKPVEDPVSSDLQAPADRALLAASALALRLDRMLSGNVRGLLARARSGLPSAHRPPDPR